MRKYILWLKVEEYEVSMIESDSLKEVEYLIDQLKPIPGGYYVFDRLSVDDKRRVMDELEGIYFLDWNAYWRIREKVDNIKIDFDIIDIPSSIEMRATIV